MPPSPPPSSDKNKKRKFRIRFIVEEEYQPLRVVPLIVWAAIFLGLGGQIALSQLQPPPQARAQDLTPPPPESTLRVAAAGDPIAFSKALMLNLQAFDNQPGISIPFRELNYSVLVEWLEGILSLDPRADYPLLSAARLYAGVGDLPRKRIMVNWVRDKFIENPLRWEWLAHCVVIARHQLKDDKLALELTQLLREKSDPEIVPAWARQMDIFLREDLDEYDSAAALLSGLLESGEAKDPQEFIFLYDRLESLLDKMVKEGKVTDEATLRARAGVLDSLRQRYLQLREEIEQ